MANLGLNDQIISQGHALARAIQALETIEPSAGFERAIARLLVKACRRRLRAIIATAPSWVGGRILEAVESSSEPREVLFGDN